MEKFDIKRKHYINWRHCKRMNDNIYTKLKITKDTVEIRNYEHLNVTRRKKGKGVEKTDEEKAYHYGWRQSEK